MKTKQELLLNQLLNSKIIDCSHALDSRCSMWPGGNRLLKCPFRTYKNDGYKCEVVVLSCDLGTHIDSPSHFIEGARTITDLKLSELICPCVVVDVSQKVKQNADYLLQVSDVIEWEKKYGKIPDKSFVCMKTGWSKFFYDEKKYQNMDSNGVMHFPGFSKEVAEFLTTQRNITGVGIDTLSLDNGPSKSFDCHVTMFKADKYQIENLNLEEVPEYGGVMFALPVKIVGAPEACARVVVVVPQ